MPMSEMFKERLFPSLKRIADHYGTPFYIYDETGIRKTGEKLKKVFADFQGFREYFAVKALPNTRILEIMKEMGFGFDCSSITELMLSRRVGAKGEDLMFSSNNTSREEFEEAAKNGGSILNLDDISLIDKVPELPELICFRYNPGDRRTGNDIIGNPVEAKYGVSHDQILEAYRRCKNRGVQRFGLHTMMASNEMDYKYMVQTTQMLLELAGWISRELDIKFEFINIGGGLGIPYKPDQPPFNIEAMAEEIKVFFNDFNRNTGYTPKLYMESGRYMTGPHGVLITTAINRKDIYRTYIGVDACMSSLMRPALYGAYHHIDVLGKTSGPSDEVVDVVGSLCENNDKFAIQRKLPKIDDGDILVIQDGGAHGHSMGFNYNGRLRPKELLLRSDGNIELIRREETEKDHFATLEFIPDNLTISNS